MLSKGCFEKDDAEQSDVLGRGGNTEAEFERMHCRVNCERVQGLKGVLKRKVL